MNSDILKGIYTVEDRRIFFEELELLMAGLYKQGENSFDNILKNRVRVSIAQALREVFQDQSVSKERYFNDLKERLDSLRIFEITLAFEPSQRFLEELFSHVNAVYGGGIILDLTYNPRIVGGCVVTFAGKYRDYSLRKTIDDYLTNHQNDILKFLA